VTEAQQLGPADIESVGPVKLGVDVARFGNDKTVLTPRVRRVVYPQVVLGKLDTQTSPAGSRTSCSSGTRARPTGASSRSPWT
jgi:hypothetical protein